MSLQINLHEIEKAMSILLKDLREYQGEVIEVEPVDYYWSIRREELYDPYQQPTDLTLGQLTDDLEEMKKIAAGKAEPVSLDLVKMSAILAMLGNKTVW
jgi:hypothetical protein